MTALLEQQPDFFPQPLTDPLPPGLVATITAYFTHLNAAAYGAMAQLFTADGVLFPPFESGVQGPGAIEQYLEAEAVGMRAFPKTMQLIESESEMATVLVRGCVQLPLFSVNVAWEFCLTTAGKIQSVRVDLLASLEELVQFRR